MPKKMGRRKIIYNKVPLNLTKVDVLLQNENISALIIQTWSDVSSKRWISPLTKIIQKYIQKWLISKNSSQHETYSLRKTESC